MQHKDNKTKHTKEVNTTIQQTHYIREIIDDKNVSQNLFSTTGKSLSF